MSIPREQPNQNKEMKISESVLMSLFMRDNRKYNIFHAPSTSLSGIQFSALNVLESRKVYKCNNTEMNKTLRKFIFKVIQLFRNKIFMYHSELKFS